MFSFLFCCVLFCPGKSINICYLCKKKRSFFINVCLCRNKELLTKYTISKSFFVNLKYWYWYLPHSSSIVWAFILAVPISYSSWFRCRLEMSKCCLLLSTWIHLQDCAALAEVCSLLLYAAMFQGIAKWSISQCVNQTRWAAWWHLLPGICFIWMKFVFLSSVFFFFFFLPKHGGCCLGKLLCSFSVYSKPNGKKISLSVQQRIPF